ncbi:photosystem reaction center subunit H [Corynebacterium phocae]|uniref:Photosystem reaction center subunit H n=1 Tax=Corynebacterium phocae TaxID=161895 RepID=A0A1L7D1B6_9CORY|nr:PRC and DUF2382 domain-containing protein [Corynebacterium phocae]APT91888.1 photosystem reaction center subunit H [Corynebacterium phocae]KAA8727389.1 DUF2382 domain-containing protein [Corynebacterium phocae]
MNKHDIQELLKATAYDANGDKLGSVNEVFVDENSGRPTFVEVNHGLFGLSSSLVPLRGHRLDGNEELHLAFVKDRISDAPDFDGDAGLDTAKQEEIYRHYGVVEHEDKVDYNLDDRRDLHAGAGVGEVRHEERRDVDLTDVNDDGELIRSEEQLNVGKERVATGTVRLRKYVVTDTETVEVPVTREEVRVERTPISAEEAARMGDVSDEDTETSVTLHEERVVVSKENVPVEKVALHTEEVTETERVSEEVRKERIETEGVDGFETKK